MASTTWTERRRSADRQLEKASIERRTPWDAETLRHPLESDDRPIYGRGATAGSRLARPDERDGLLRAGHDAQAARLALLRARRVRRFASVGYAFDPS